MQVFRNPVQANCSQERGTHQGALMHASVERFDALIVVCTGDAASTAAALAHVVDVDPISAGVPMRQVMLVAGW